MSHEELVLERRAQADGTVLAAGAVSLPPVVNEGYWSYRVRLGHGQAVLGFPKHSTVGIGFAIEDDWNTNLPYRCGTDEIVSHILHNKRFECISDEDVRRAVLMVQEAAADDVRDPRGGVGSLAPVVRVPHPVDEDDETTLLLPCPDEAAEGEAPAPATLADWYERLVEVAADGDAPPFEWEAERIVRLAAEHAGIVKYLAELRYADWVRVELSYPAGEPMIEGDIQVKNVGAALREIARVVGFDVPESGR